MTSQLFTPRLPYKNVAGFLFLALVEWSTIRKYSTLVRVLVWIHSLSCLILLSWNINQTGDCFFLSFFFYMHDFSLMIRFSILPICFLVLSIKVGCLLKLAVKVICEGHLTINGAVLCPDHLPVRQRCLVRWEIQVNIKSCRCSCQGGSIVFQIKSHFTPWKRRGRTVKHLCKGSSCDAFVWFYKH